MLPTDGGPLAVDERQLDLFDETLDGLCGLRVTKVHDEVLDTEIGQMSESFDQLFGIVVGLRKR